MTHLVIELPTTGIELVSNSVIEKLYNLAVSGDLDASSNLQGRLNVGGTYLEYIDELLDLFDELYISATKIYINFADDEVKRVLVANNIGDGIGITLIDLSNVSSVSSWFLGNTNIVSFNELRYTNVHTINGSAFKGCASLTSIDLSNVTNIGDLAFLGCTVLTGTIGLSNVTNIGQWGFYNCRNLSLNVSLLLNLQEIGAYAFAYDSLVTGDLNLPNLTGYIERGTFYNTSITKILSLGHIHSIQEADSRAESRAFGGCTSLTEVDLSTTTSLTSIGTASFIGCSALTLVKLPSSVTSIGGWAFAGTQLMIEARTYYIYATTPPTLSARHSIGTEGSSIVLPAAIYVPAGSVENYKTASVWSDFASVILAMPIT